MGLSAGTRFQVSRRSPIKVVIGDCRAADERNKEFCRRGGTDLRTEPRVLMTRHIAQRLPFHTNFGPLPSPRPLSNVADRTRSSTSRRTPFEVRFSVSPRRAASVSSRPPLSCDANGGQLFHALFGPLTSSSARTFSGVFPRCFFDATLRSPRASPGSLPSASHDLLPPSLNRPA